MIGGSRTSVSVVKPREESDIQCAGDIATPCESQFPLTREDFTAILGLIRQSAKISYNNISSIKGSSERLPNCHSEPDEPRHASIIFQSFLNGVCCSSEEIYNSVDNSRPLLYPLSVECFSHSSISHRQNNSHEKIRTPF